MSDDYTLDLLETTDKTRSKTKCRFCRSAVISGALEL